MSYINTSDQFFTTAKGPLDAKQTPVATYDDLQDLSRIPRANRYVGLTVSVLNTDNGNLPCDYWLVGGTTNASWKIKQGNVIDTYEHLISISPSACTVGLEMVVQSDSQNDNALSKYWVTAIENGTVTWERKQYGTEFPVTGNDREVI